MIGFLKWLWNQYQSYKLNEIFKSTDEDKAALFMNNYKNCLEAGFSELQLIAIMNLLHTK